MSTLDKDVYERLYKTIEQAILDMTIKEKSNHLEHEIRGVYIGRGRYNYLLFEMGMEGIRLFSDIDITSTIKKKDVKILITIDTCMK